MIVAGGHEACAAIDVLLRLFWRARGNSPPNSGVTRGLCNPIDRGLYEGMIKLERHAVANAQIARSNKQEVNTRDGSDLLYAINTLSVFHLKCEEHLAVGMRESLLDSPPVQISLLRYDFSMESIAEPWP